MRWGKMAEEIHSPLRKGPSAVDRGQGTVGWCYIWACFWYPSPWSTSNSPAWGSWRPGFVCRCAPCRGLHGPRPIPSGLLEVPRIKWEVGWRIYGTTGHWFHSTRIGSIWVNETQLGQPIMSHPYSEGSPPSNLVWFLLRQCIRSRWFGRQVPWSSRNIPSLPA